MNQKRITQSTFDDVVRENIDDLEMDPEEAVKDAIEQFKAQGVNLNNIVTDLVITPDGSSWHPVIVQVNLLKETSSEDTDKLCEVLKSLQRECGKSLAHRCLAASHQAFSTLLNHFAQVSSSETVSTQVLSTLSSLLSGQPDLVTDDAMDVFLSVAKSQSSSKCMLGIKLIKQSCVMHETNRQSFVGKGVVGVLAEAIKTFKSNGNILKVACQALRTLTLDDDPRAPFGKSHDHAKMIVLEADALELLLDIAKEYSDETVLGELFTTIGSLAVRNEFCQRIMDLGGVHLMLTTLDNHMSNKVISTQIIGVLKAIGGNDDVKVVLAKSFAPSIIVATMDKHQASEALSCNACACLATIALRNPDNGRMIFECYGHTAIVQCMKIHSESPNVQKQACIALRNLIARSRLYCEPILALGAEELINKAMMSDPAIKDECKAALRDLGCKVELTERWTGERGSLQQ